MDKPHQSFVPHRALYMETWRKCMSAGYSTQDARDMAQWEVDSRVANETKLSDDQIYPQQNIERSSYS